MMLKELTVILRRNDRGRLVAIAEQMTSEGLVYGTNMLGGKRTKNPPKTFAEARTLVERVLNGSVEKLTFREEAPEWE